MAEDDIFLCCEKCSSVHETKLIPIGANTWAAIWKPFNLVENTLQGAMK